MQSQIHSSQGDSTMKIEISSRLLEEAETLLKENGGLSAAVCIPSKGGEVCAILSPNPNDLIPLRELVHDGQTYYLGIPRE